MNTIATRISSALLLCLAFTAADAQRGPLATALPATPSIQLLVDPLDAPTDHCDFNAHPSEYVKIDATQVRSARKLRRLHYPDTAILGLNKTSPHWLTTCPVVLNGTGAGTAACRPYDVLAGGTLRIVRAGNSIRFKIEGTRVGTVRGNLTPVANPHGAQEDVWLRSSQVTHSDGTNPHDYYVYLQDINGYKYYLVEVFDRTDQNCLSAHLPSKATLCKNDGRQSHCDLDPTSSATHTTTSSVKMNPPPDLRPTPASARVQAGGTSYPGTKVGGKSAARVDTPRPPYIPPQTDTGGGHEPPPRTSGQ